MMNESTAAVTIVGEIITPSFIIYLWLGKSLIDHATRHIEHTVLLAIHETKENTKR